MIKWIVNIAIALLMGLNTLFWGLCIREVGEPSLSFDFFSKLAFNRFFIVALACPLSAAFLRYSVLHEMGVLRGGFFLTTSTVASILVARFALNEEPSPLDWLGIVLVVLGAFILGR